MIVVPGLGSALTVRCAPAPANCEVCFMRVRWRWPPSLPWSERKCQPSSGAPMTNLRIALSRTPEELRVAFANLHSARDVADILEVPYGQLMYITSQRADLYGYSTFTIPKRSGGERNISAPHPTVKILQSKINNILKQVYEPRASTHGFAKPESTDRSLRGRAAGLAESSAGVAALAGRCRGRTGARSRRSTPLGGAEGAGARVREACAGMLARASEPAGAVSGRQAGSGSARNRASAAAHWPAQGQRFGRCRVQRRAEWVSRPARAK